MVPTDSIVAHGDPVADARAFRRCLGQFATGVTVITAHAGELPAGVTANSFSSLSLDPPLILWSIRRSARSFPVFRDARHFAVNILAASQIDVSRCFASAEADKFARTQWQTGPEGAPLLEGAVAHLECSTEAQYDGGDHLIIVGRVRRFSHFAGDGLVFAQGRYGIAEDHPDLRPERQSIANPPDDMLRDSLTLRLLFYALHYMHADFEQSAPGGGLPLAQIRVLTGLYDKPGSGIEQLAERTYLGQRDAEDAVGDLVESGDVVRLEGGVLELTASGRARREAIRQRMQEFEKAFLADVPKSEVAAGRRFLERLIAKHVAPIKRS